MSAFTHMAKTVIFIIITILLLIGGKRFIFCEIMLPILHTYTHILHIKGLCHYLKNVILVYYSEIFNYIFLFI